MYDVFIIDNEPVIREGLKNLIDWNSLGFSICGDSDNGYDAIKQIMALNPQVVITDIKMPVLSGLEIIRQLKGSGYQGSVIIISGYADFSYAHTAIAYGVKSYLLKPVDERELAGTLYSIRKELQSQKQLQPADMVLNLSYQKFWESFLTGLLKPDEIPHFLDLYTKNITASSFQVVILKFMTRITSSKRLENLWEDLSKAIANRSVIRLYYNEQQIVFLSQLPPQETYICFQRLLKQSLSDSEHHFFISIGSNADRLDSIPESFLESRKLIDHFFLLGYKKIIQYVPDGPAEEDAPILFDEKTASQKIIQAIESSRLSDINDTIEQMKRYFIRCGTSEMEVKMKSVNLFSMISDHFIQSFPELTAANLHRDEFIENCYFQSTLTELAGYLKKYLYELSDTVGQFLPDNDMDAMIQYIGKNYQSNLRLDQLAGIFNYNPNYLGRKFKLYTGKTFNEYLDGVRIQKAIELIREGLKIYEISRRVGYSNVDYFSDKFKKYVGMSPGSFRRRMEKS